MALPTPNLDDRKFQDIVDEAKRLIPTFCSEWTDHNVSDPGVALIELFAWMTEMMLYRVNQIPDKAYIKFLELIGVYLGAATPATGDVTFYLTAPASADVMVAKGTEVATVRTPTQPAEMFTTKSTLVVHPVNNATLRAFTNSSLNPKSFYEHRLGELGVPNKTLQLFPEYNKSVPTEYHFTRPEGLDADIQRELDNRSSPKDGDAFYLLLDQDYSQHVLALVCQCDKAQPGGINPANPPREWQVWLGKEGVRWANCDVEYDGTQGFTEPAGEIILHLPEMGESALAVGSKEIKGYLLRCRVSVDATDRGRGRYQYSPLLRALRVESRGGTAAVNHAVAIKDEVLGYSDGTPGQTFKLLNAPILDLDPATDKLKVIPPSGPEDDWQKKDDFAESRGSDPHYVLDTLNGTVTFGPSLLQPGVVATPLQSVSSGRTGKLGAAAPTRSEALAANALSTGARVYNFGKIPPKGSRIKFARYQQGGGERGNVAAHTVTMLKTALADVARVDNRQPMMGGRDIESLDHAKLRAPLAMRTLQRAVTADDYEYWALQASPSVARAHCLAPGAQPGSANIPKPGQVIIVVLPRANDMLNPVIEQMTLAADLRGTVLEELQKRSVIGVMPDVQPPNFVWIQVEATLLVPSGSDPAIVQRVKEEAELRLSTYLNPYVGGPRGEGWPFGRELYRNEIYGLLQAVPSVEFVDTVRVFPLKDANNLASRDNEVTDHLPLLPSGLICSARHTVVVNPKPVR